VDLDNGVRGSLKAFGLKVGRVGASGFADRVLELLQGRPSLAAVVRPLLAARAELARQFAVLDAELRRLVRQHGTCRRLMTVPGVGPVASLAYVTALDDPSRFRRSREVGADLGLTPRRYQSGEVDRLGRVSKAGDLLAREALFLAAHTLLTRVKRPSALRLWGLAVAKRRGLRRATVAVARRLAVLLHRIWRDGTTFRWPTPQPAA